jgi:long-chain acyl-CoA synthetase
VTNIADLVREAARARGQHAALVTQDRSISWGELAEQVERAAAALTGELPAKGSRVALMLPNCPEFAIAYFAILRAGMVAVPLNTGYTAPEVARACTDAGAVVLLQLGISGKTISALQRKCPELRVVDVASAEGVPFVGGGADVPEGWTAPRVGPRDLAVLMYTSGSEGRPKGAMLSHGALRANIDALARLRKPAALTPDDVMLLVLPLFHIFGLNAGLGLAARKGATCVLVERFEPRTSLQIIRDMGVTMVAGAPPMYVAWSVSDHLQESMAGVRLMISGASALPVEVFHQFQTLIGKPIFEGYGLTECAPVVTSCLVGGVAKAGSVGRPVPGVEISLRDETGAEVEADDPGELWVRSRSLFSGYWPDGRGGPDAEGWFPTGDVAVCDEDGDYHLVDRRHDLIIVSGFNVYPREIEDVIASHPAVAEVAVIGAEHPMTGEAVRAVVVLKPGYEEPTDLRQFCEARLARFKCPSIITYVPRLPRAVTGKIAKSRVKKL